MTTWAGVLPCACGDRGDHRVFEHQALAERAPGLGDDPELGVLVAQAGLLEAGVQLDLVDRGVDAGLRDDPLEVGGLEVGDADRAHEPLRLELDERPPGVHVRSCAGTGQWIR